jgi:hypothetical protein
MLYLSEFARNRILRGGYLTQDDITQEQYTIATDRNTSVKEIFRLYDTLFGGNFSKLHANNPNNLPYLPDDVSLDILPQDDYPDSEFVDSPEPVRPDNTAEIA